MINTAFSYAKYLAFADIKNKRYDKVISMSYGKINSAKLFNSILAARCEIVMRR